MFLKKLKISGFKSFAKPITIKFNSPLTAIVGPNGSGKSNIVDAIRWVLGEQSAHTLRGNKMADIIFSGSKNYKPLNKASVFLYLDNSDQTLDINSDEVVIGRKVNSSGESDYFLNNESCRLKDIKELLLDTGLGKDHYSIVGQGKITSILNSKPEKIRELFEEAAGISKYKVRKEEAESKLENTGQNLQRINDLITELRKQLAPLKKDVDKAERYNNLSQKLADLEISLFLEKWEKNRTELSSLAIDKEFLEDKLLTIQNELKELEDDYVHNTQNLTCRKEELSEKKDKIFRLKTKSEELNNKLKLYREREVNIIDDINDNNNWKKMLKIKKKRSKIKLTVLLKIFLSLKGN